MQIHCGFARDYRLVVRILALPRNGTTVETEARNGPGSGLSLIHSRTTRSRAEIASHCIILHSAHSISLGFPYDAPIAKCLTANGWSVLAEPAGKQRPLIPALEQLRSQSHPIIASLRFPNRGDSRLSPVVRLRVDGNWHAKDCALQCHGPSNCRLDVAAVSRSSF